MKTKLWSLSAKFDCPVTCQKLSLLATAHDCETDFFSTPIIALERLSLAYLLCSWKAKNKSGVEPGVTVTG